MTDDEVIQRALNILEARMKKPEEFFTRCEDATAYLKLQFSELEYESFRVMFLNSQHGMIVLEELFRGTINSSAVYPREVVKAALHFNAAAVILSHNHPSGCTQPSQADIAITKRLAEAMNLVEISVLDHIVISADSSYSFAQHGLLPILK